MNVGDTVRLRNFRNYLDDGRSWVEYKADKGKVFVCVLLGVEDQDACKPGAELLDPAAILDAMGWTKKVAPQEVKPSGGFAYKGLEEQREQGTKEVDPVVGITGERQDDLRSGTNAPRVRKRKKSQGN